MESFLFAAIIVALSLWFWHRTGVCGQGLVRLLRRPRNGQSNEVLPRRMEQSILPRTRSVTARNERVNQYGELE